MQRVILVINVIDKIEIIRELEIIVQIYLDIFNQKIHLMRIALLV